MLNIYRNMFKVPDLRGKILFTLAIFGVYRLGATIPVPGIDLDAVQAFQEQQQAGGIYGLLNLFSGGALEQFSVFSLGIIPYITASIMMQLLTVVIPKLQALQDCSLLSEEEPLGKIGPKGEAGHGRQHGDLDQ